MTPIHIIRDLARDAEQPDIEMICARLQHHGFKMKLESGIISDTGSSWGCKLNDWSREVCHEGWGPSMRTAILKALNKASDEEAKINEEIRNKSKD